MVLRTLLSVVLLLFLVRFLTAEEQEDAGPPTNPPVVLIATDIDAEGNLVLVEYETIVIQPAGPLGAGGQRITRHLTRIPLKGVQIRDREGKPVKLEAARKQLGGKDTAILVLSWEEPLAPEFRRLFRDDVLIFVFPEEAPTWKRI